MRSRNGPAGIIFGILWASAERCGAAAFLAGCGAKPEPVSGGLASSVTPARPTPEEQARVAEYYKEVHRGTGRFNEAGEVDSLNLSDALLTDYGMASIEKLPALRSLNLINTRITDAGLAHVKNLTHLTRLDLSHNPITDDGLNHLLQLKDLRVLSLAHTQITDRGLSKLAASPNLQFLNVAHTQVTDAGNVHFTRNTTGRRCEITH
ncbi:MAG: hypothetical protein EXS22_09990 [Pedosphaera sp.]|nr:hypothetical protein [Pedosphaera sp.]